MALDAKHPMFSARLADWRMLRDFYLGESAVKSRGTVYLPPTKGMLLDGMGSRLTSSAAALNLGQEAYNAYLARAVFPDYVKEAVESFVGIMHQKPATIELPSALEPLRERATLYGESLQLLLRKINEQQLVTGRVGLLLDLPAAPSAGGFDPYLALYVAEAIPNWDTGEIFEGPAKLNLVVLNESGWARKDDFEWEEQAKYRVLMLSPEDGKTYLQGAFVNQGGGVPTFVMSDMLPPQVRGAALERIPFVFVNSKDITPEPDEGPLLGLAQICRAIYNGEADYRGNLFMQGQDTFVIIGDRKRSGAEILEVDEPTRTGAGAMLELEPGGDAKYVGVNSQGLAEQRLCIDSDRARAEARAAQLVSAKQGGVESGEALNTRVAAMTTTLVQIAEAGAAGLQEILRIAAEWAGADPSEVVVTPNKEFSAQALAGQTVIDLMTARAMGAPISLKSIHAVMSKQGVTEMNYEAELDLVEEESANNPALLPTPTDPANSNEDQ